jgi:hypothetical protein
MRRSKNRVTLPETLEQLGGYYEEIFENLPSATLILDPDVHILDFNRAAFTFLRKEPDTVHALIGDAIGCHNAVSSPGGCGTSDKCSECGIRNAVADSVRNRRTCTSVVDMVLVTEHGVTPQTFLISSAVCRPCVSASAPEPETVILTFQPLNDCHRGPRDGTASRNTGQRLAQKSARKAAVTR